LIAVKWPPDYRGQFDERIFSTVNILKYLLVSLNSDQAPKPEFDRENLYVMDEEKKAVLVVEDGDISDFETPDLAPEKSQ